MSNGVNTDNLWGRRWDEVIGHHVLGLDIGLPAERLNQPLRDCRNGQRQSTEMQLDATNRRGKTIRCRVTARETDAARYENSNV
jgi:two-component system CheB/CheR fusion protein